jgi:hypothetical protein
MYKTRRIGPLQIEVPQEIDPRIWYNMIRKDYGKKMPIPTPMYIPHEAPRQREVAIN